MSDNGKLPNGKTTPRRSFFSEAFKEILRPVSGLLEKKMQPVMRALDQLPTEGPGTHTPGTLDQPHLNEKHADTAPTQPNSILNAPTRYLRPPGARPEGMPEGLDVMCSHCGACVEACPAHAIQIDKTGLVADGLPYIVPKEMPCVVCDSLACMPACPSGALKILTRTEIRMGMAKVDYNQCLRRFNEDCRLCIESCPYGDNAITITASGRIRVKLNGCTGCGLCEHACPTDPAAIVVEPAKPPREPLIA